MSDKKEKLISSISHGIQRCHRCERADTRNHAIPGEGRTDSKIVLLGEAPGQKEDQSGRPFVGRAGTYLDKIFHSYSMERMSVYITSILKCYHPDPPKRHQIKNCRPWTEKQINALQPELILVMGRTAEQGLFDKIHEERKDIIVEWKDIPCIITCHPAAAMRFPERDEQFRHDFHKMIEKADKKGLL
jgi:uracil-DNA glycosylase